MKDLERFLASKKELAYALLRTLSGLMFSLHGVQKLFGVLTDHQPAVFSQVWIGGIIELAAGLAIALGAPARRLDVDPGRLTDVRRQSLALAACEAVGVAQRALDLAAEHTKTRQQFGRVIGTYQGVSHKVADIYVALQLNRSLAYWAAWAVSEGDDQQDVAVAAAKASATDAAVFACESAIQVHGGIGFTWEHVLHRFYKRAQWLQSFAGVSRTHRARVADVILAS